MLRWRIGMAILAIVFLMPLVGAYGQSYGRQGLPQGVTGGDAANQEIALSLLFDRLAAAKDESAARRTASEIWRIWFQSPNEDIHKLMQRTQFARRAGLHEQALSEINKVVQIAPNYAEGWNQRATILFLLGRNVDSVRDIQRVLELEPRHFGALSGLGLIHMREQNWKSAIASFERALKIHPFLRERSLLLTLRRKLQGQAL